VKFSHRVAVILSGCALAFAGCSGSGSAGKGSGGQTGSSGGTTGSGGTSSSGSGGKGSGGSTPSSGGTQGSGSGGTQGSGSGGASSSSGGAPATGGSTGSGGSSGSNGSGSGGSNGSGGKGGAMATGSGGSGPGAGGSSGGAGASGTGSGGSSTTGVTVQMDKTHQMIEGFGLNDALAPSSAAYSSTVLDNLFTTKNADSIGLSILRVGMNSDGSLSSPSGDISGAKSRNAKIIGSCWSPPASCKTNNNTQNGGHLISNDNGKCYDSWSTTIANFAKSQNLYAMSIGNEPDFASCGSTEPCNGNYDTTLYTANEMVNFLKVAGPKLKANNVKVITPEASEWTHTWSNISACCSDPGKKNSSDPLKCGFPPSNADCDKGNGYDYGHWLAKDTTAWAAFDILGTHEYDSQHAEPWPADVTGGKPDAGHEVWETEMSGVKWWLQQGPSCDIANGVAVGGWIHSALTVGEASAWLWWWYQSYYTDDNEGLLLMSGSKASGCDATKPTKRYYVLGQYSKFVRPGYTRVEVNGNSSTDVLLSAFTGPGGAMAIVAINQGSAAANIPISITGGTAPATMTPYMTSSSANIAAQPAVTVTNGSFMASLPSNSVTTFVAGGATM